MKYFANQTLVVPFDFSDSASEAVDDAIALAEDSTIIHVIHVVDPTPVMISIDPALPVPPSFDHERHARALQRMQAIFGKEEYSRVKIECTIGDPGSEIVDFASSIHANMIIMPSHGRTGMSRLLLGSVAERVLRLATCPVLILRKSV